MKIGVNGLQGLSKAQTKGLDLTTRRDVKGFSIQKLKRNIL